MNLNSLNPTAVPFFLPGSAGNLFAIYHSPEESVDDKGDVIYVHPFAEEMNQSRSIVALHARELAKLGFRVLLLNLYGCGDSAGEFRDARWEIWKKDLNIAVQWLQDQGRKRINLWGLRLGSLLALEFASESPLNYERLLIWQPVLSGDELINQFLRRCLTATDAAASPGKKETTQTLRERLVSGELVEVTGYELAPELALSISSVRLPCSVSLASQAIYWVEVISEPEDSIAPSRQQIVELWKNAGAKVSVYQVVAEPFWILPHRKTNLELLRTMKQIFDERVYKNA